MIRFTWVFAAILTVFAANAVNAQANAWLQIEARPSLGVAEERARNYASQLPDVGGYRLSSGWYAITLGPYSPDEAAVRLSQLRIARAVPNDAFVSDGRNFRARFWPGEGAVLTAPAATAQPLPPLTAGEETPSEARASERLLTRTDREQLQMAMRWEGFYRSSIDGSFGPGTRAAMRAWQENRRYEPTGILTTLQRRELLEGYQSVLDSLSMRLITDNRAGIDIAVPSAMVKFARYEPPFAHYGSTSDDGVRVVLISQSGDDATLTGLYDVMQTLEIVPLEGARNRGRRSFTLTGQNDRISSYTYAELRGGEVKGFSLVWPAGDEQRFQLALQEMQASFVPIDGIVLPDSMATSTTQDIDLLSGLQLRRPDVSRSGFFVDSSGAVLTTTDAVGQCQRVTLNDEFEANIFARDDALGLALLKPTSALNPLAFGRLSTAAPRLQADIAVSGFSYEGILGAPSVTYGTLADVKGLDGNQQVERLALTVQDGDAGGPVFDATGSVMGMLLPRPKGDARVLPADVSFATDAPVIAEFLSANGLSAAASDRDSDMAPEDLALMAADMTVLVSCWN